MTFLRAIAGACIAAAIFASAVAQAEKPFFAERMMDDLMWNHGPIGGPFTLTDQTGKPRSDTEFRGRLMLIYFGYTFCPDVCPTDLMSISQAIQSLGEAGNAVQPIFISVDPERDTPAVLGEYTSAFHPRLIGLTGLPEQIRVVALLYRAWFARVPDAVGKGYSIDHTGVIYLVGRDGQYLGFAPPRTEPARLVEILRKLIDK